MHRYVAPLALLLAAIGPLTAQERLPAAEWRADLARMTALIDSVHPWPWRRLDSLAFHHAVAGVSAQVDSLDDAAIAAHAMRLVASLRDGHTRLYPAGRAAFNQWFPVRFHRLDSVLVITAIDSNWARFVGGTVITVGDVPAGEAADRMASLLGIEHPAGASERVALLANAPLTAAAGLSDGQRLGLQVRRTTGAVEPLVLPTRTGRTEDEGWLQRGEMFGPAGLPVVSAFGLRTPLQYREGSLELPLHLRNRIPIWFTWQGEDSTLYVQSNFVQDFGATAFQAVVDSVFAAADALPVRRMVLDLRYNSGGDGSLLLPFVHQLIRRPALAAPGRLAVLTGNKTFSAAVLWLSLLRIHTGAVTIGEAPGAPRNHAGDAATFSLPNSGMTLHVSTLRHYGTRSDDTTSAELPDFPISMTAADYFAGRDPVLAMARSHEDLRTIPHLFLSEGATTAMATLARRRARFAAVPGWRAFDERALNAASYDLLASGRQADALVGFRLNTEAYPASGNTWDSYGEAQLALGDTTAAIVSYRRSLEHDPGNGNARDVLRRLGALP